MYFDHSLISAPNNLQNAALGAIPTNPLMIKHDFSLAIRSVSVTSD